MSDSLNNAVITQRTWDRASKARGETWLRAFQRDALRRALKGATSVVDFGGDGSFIRSIDSHSEFSILSLDLHAPSADFAEDLNQESWTDIDFGEVDLLVANNLIEHLAAPEAFLRRVSEKFHLPTRILIQVPVLFMEHPSPQDYGRYLVDWWEEKLRFLGFSDVHIEKQCVGAITVANSMLFMNKRFPGRLSFGILSLSQKLDRYLSKSFYTSSTNFYVGLSVSATLPIETAE